MVFNRKNRVIFGAGVLLVLLTVSVSLAEETGLQQVRQQLGFILSQDSDSGFERARELLRSQAPELRRQLADQLAGEFTTSHIYLGFSELLDLGDYPAAGKLLAKMIEGGKLGAADIGSRLGVDLARVDRRSLACLFSQTGSGLLAKWGNYSPQEQAAAKVAAAAVFGIPQALISERAIQLLVDTLVAECQG